MFRKKTIIVIVTFAVIVLVAVCGGTAFASGGGGSSDPLSFDAAKRDLALWSFAIFAILFFVLWKFAFGPIAVALDAREKSVADQIASAEQANAEAKAVLEEYKKKLSDAQDEVRQIIDTARKDAQRAADGIIEKAKEAARQENVRAVKEIETATAVALQQIAERSASLATNLAGKMIRAQVNPDNHREIIRRAVEDFSKT